jgi:hypothetical protein
MSLPKRSVHLACKSFASVMILVNMGFLRASGDEDYSRSLVVFLVLMHTWDTRVLHHSFSSYAIYSYIPFNQTPSQILDPVRFIF